MSTQESLEDLQSRLAFQEQTLQELNAVVARQSGQVARLEQQLRALAGKYRDLRDTVEQGPGGEGEASSERPPHY